MQDSEVHVPRYLSAKERARLEADAAEEAARARANAGNDMTARALKQMMNGNPNGNIGVVNQAMMSQPAWMNADPSTFTTEQQQEVIFVHQHLRLHACLSSFFGFCLLSINVSSSPIHYPGLF